MLFKRDYTEEQPIEKKRPRRLLAIGSIGLLAIICSSCGIGDEELKQLKATNKQLSEGINQILIRQNEKKADLEKPLKTAFDSLENGKTEVEKLKDDLKSVESESAKAAVKQSLERKIAAQEKLKKEVAILKEKMQGVEELRKELKALLADPEKTESPTPAPKSQGKES